jgi:hypothetical protein
MVLCCEVLERKRLDVDVEVEGDVGWFRAEAGSLVGGARSCCVCRGSAGQVLRGRSAIVAGDDVRVLWSGGPHLGWREHGGRILHTCDWRTSNANEMNAAALNGFLPLARSLGV